MVTWAQNEVLRVLQVADKVLSAAGGETSSSLVASCMTSVKLRTVPCPPLSINCMLCRCTEWRVSQVFEPTICKAHFIATKLNATSSILSTEVSTNLAAYLELTRLKQSPLPVTS